jgi:hypothetical protein
MTSPTVNRMAVFDQNVAALRTHVERYIELGYCELNQSRPHDVLDSPGIIENMCKRIGKQLGRPWVEVIDHGHTAWLRMKIIDATKHLRTPIVLVGANVDYMSQGPAVQYTTKKNQFMARFQGEGLKMLEAWKQTVATDKACRFALKLPLR